MLVSLFLLAGLIFPSFKPAPDVATPGNTIGRPFSLLGSTGQTINSDQFRGQFLLVYFGYTNCPDQCPLTLEIMTKAVRQLGPRAALVQLLFITIDPARDTPSVIGQYVKLFSNHLIGLTGSLEAIHQTEAKFHVYVGTPDPKTGQIQHGSLLYVMGPDGRFRTALPSNLSASALATALNNIIGGEIPAQQVRNFRFSKRD